jgi:hypothetical protein
MQFAAKDRNQGIYGELGLGFATTYAVSGGGTTFTVSSPTEFKLGAGYRIDRPASNATADINLGMDIGTMETAKLSSASARASGAVEGAPTHVVLALSIIAHFSL